MNKDILKRLDRLQLKGMVPVIIYELFRMPDGSEAKMRFETKECRSRWKEENAAELIDILVEVR